MTRWLLLLCGVFMVAAATPQRIVSLKPNITEFLFTLNAGEQVVGVTTWCDFPAAARTLPKVADYLRPNIEAIAALKPDLIIGSTENSLAAPIQQLRKLGMPLLLLPFDTIAETINSLRALGVRVGQTERAAELALHLETALAPRTAPNNPLHTLLLIGVHPPIAAGPKSLFGELLDRSGAINVITAGVPRYPQLDDESLTVLRPNRIIIAASDSTHLPPELARIPHVSINPDLFRPGPRLDQAFQALQRAVEAR